tara:strand:+ start:3366 stop:4349 length:984 start_codon:yes stop_codon:yes gene_type:complete
MNSKTQFKPNVKGEMDEVKRVSQYLTRHEDFPVSVDDVKNALKNAEEITLTKNLWDKLENTESNTIKDGEFVKVLMIAKHYNKSNPYKLKMKLANDDYERPMIVKFGNRYHVVSGNTRLCTAASMGMNPKVFLGDLNNLIESTSKKSLIIKENVDVDKITKLFDTIGPSMKNLKYIGVKDNVSNVEYTDELVKYHGGIGSVMDKIEADCERLYRDKELSYECGGYSIRFRYLSMWSDDVQEFGADLFINIEISHQSEFSLFDGTSGDFEHLINNEEWFDEELGYSEGTGYEMMTEVRDCLRQFFDRDIYDRYGVSVYELRIMRGYDE